MPNKINILEPHVADLIAAGEVVERPASAVKELIENAIDAGATHVTAESAGGGSRLLRVMDNGCGMSADDAERAFLRHATSKIRDAGDLAAVTTLGFRGEALAAISAVSRIQLLTRERERALGFMLNLEAGQVAERSEAGCPEGTTIVVRDLFYNTPARQKFLKKDVTETAHIQAVCQRAALSHPDISFLFLRDGRQAFLTPGDGLLRSCLYSLFGRDFVDGLCEVNYTLGRIHVWGFVSRPEAAQGSRNAQHVLVGGRPVRSGTVVAALEEAYKNTIMTGRYPACALHIDLPPNDCDINVHPAKSEIKFARNRDVFDAVYFAVKHALETVGAPNEKTMSVHDVFIGYGGAATPSSTPSPSPAFVASFVPASSPAPDPLAPDVSLPPVPDFRYIGEALDGYLLTEGGDELLLIDKHAAHERILFNQLKASVGAPMAQILLSPLAVALPPADASALLEYAELLSGTGFSVEPFGGGTLAVREAPAGVDVGDIPALLGEIAARLREGSRDPRPQLFDDVLHLLACKAAIKLGHRTPPAEAEALTRRVLEDPNLRFCPHGRPICVALSRGVIEKLFRR